MEVRSPRMQASFSRLIARKKVSCFWVVLSDVMSCLKSTCQTLTEEAEIRTSLTRSQGTRRLMVSLVSYQLLTYTWALTR